MSHYKPDPNKNVNLTINGIPVTVPEGTRILEAARKVGIKIPTLCEHPDLRKRSVCRLCVVEIDGRGKLVAACAYDVSEGLSVVTHNARIITIRKTIIELLLANHLHDCLNCIRNNRCELQTLAADFGIRESAFRRDNIAGKRPLSDAGALVRDMDKCVKCGRCVEACQEIQTIRAIDSACRGVNYRTSAPYDQALAGGPCVFCGHCASVCPVGAIYEHELSEKAWAALRDSGRHAVAQFSPELAAAFDGELNLAPGTVSAGRIVSALKLLGFAKVFNLKSTADAAVTEESRELLDRIKNRGKLPMISGCSPGCYKFIENSYPDLAGYLASYEGSQEAFRGRIKNVYAPAAGVDAACVTTVSVEPCIARKFKMPRPGSDPCRDAGLTLTVAELGRMFKMAGITLAAMPETPFDTMDGKPETSPAPLPLREIRSESGIREVELPLEGNKVKILIVHGYANARAVMDSIAKGECGAAWVKIMACPRTDGDGVWNYCPSAGFEIEDRI